jgi:hypothetical protein
MPLTLAPLNDAADPWVMALERLETKIKDTNLSFSQYCVTAFGKQPKVFALAAPGADAMVADPSLDDCPAVVLDIAPTGQPEDHGAGGERWPFTIGVYFKGFATDGNKKKLLRAFHELIRTVFCGWRTGTLDPLSTIGTGNYYMIPSDITPQIATPAVGLLVGRGAFGVRFTFAENILG